MVKIGIDIPMSKKDVRAWLETKSCKQCTWLKTKSFNVHRRCAASFKI